MTPVILKFARLQKVTCTIDPFLSIAQGAARCRVEAHDSAAAKLSYFLHLAKETRSQQRLGITYINALQGVAF
jgi:hypothetical protein